MQNSVFVEILWTCVHAHYSSHFTTLHKMRLKTTCTCFSGKLKSMLQGYKLIFVLVLFVALLTILHTLVTTSIFDQHQMPRFSITPCPLIPPELVGPFQAKVVPLKDMARHFPALEPGGTWRPAHCAPRQRVAIVVPYRDRPHHLPVLLSTLHTMLPRQLLHYRIFVVEQAGKGIFNKGMLMNIGFLEALKLHDAQCFIFHDVDLIPENDKNLYTCDKKPKHMAVAVDVFNYQLPYQEIFGGVVSMTKEVFLTVDGYSNLYWGWGAEDDDMFLRIEHAGLQVTRYPSNFTKYRMLKHVKRRRNYYNLQILFVSKIRKRYPHLNRKKDGVRNLRYRVKKVQLVDAYTHIVVQLDPRR